MEYIDEPYEKLRVEYNDALKFTIEVTKKLKLEHPYNFKTEDIEEIIQSNESIVEVFEGGIKAFFYKTNWTIKGLIA